jgi:PTS system N-acetylgalactosamine-specific IIA component
LAKLIIVGHGIYGTAAQKTLAMIIGETPGIFYIDFNIEEDLESLIGKLNAALSQCDDNEVLFACDIAGGSPFRQCATLCLNAPGKYYAVAGLNVAAYAEMAFNLGLSVSELLDLAIETAHAAIMRFPQEAE